MLGALDDKCKFVLHLLPMCLARWMTNGNASFAWCECVGLVRWQMLMYHSLVAHVLGMLDDKKRLLHLLLHTIRVGWQIPNRLHLLLDARCIGRQMPTHILFINHLSGKLDDKCQCILHLLPMCWACWMTNENASFARLSPLDTLDDKCQNILCSLSSGSMWVYVVDSKHVAQMHRHYFSSVNAGNHKIWSEEVHPLTWSWRSNEVTIKLGDGISNKKSTIKLERNKANIKLERNKNVSIKLGDEEATTHSQTWRWKSNNVTIIKLEDESNSTILDLEMKKQQCNHRTWRWNKQQQSDHQT